MRPSSKVLFGVLLVCVLAAAIRSVPSASSPRLFGYDPYVHYYFAGYAVEHGRVAPMDGFQGGLEDDRAYWPGLHVLAGGTEAVAGMSRLAVFRSLPQFLGTLTVLLVFLLSRKMFGTVPALVSAMLYAVADHSVFQSSWLVQETLGIMLLVAFLFVLTRLDPTRRWEGAVLLVLVYVASLASHHFSHAILLATFLLAAYVTPRRDDRNRLLGMFILLLPLTLAWWIGFGGRTGSFPDIAHRTMGVLGSPLGVALVWVVVIVLAIDLWQGRRIVGLWRWGLASVHHLATWLDQGRARLTLLGIIATVMIAAALWAFNRLFTPVPGLGVNQVTKYALISLGAIGAVALIAKRDAKVHLLLGLFLLLLVGYASVMFVLTFLPLQLRFFEFAYIPLAILGGLGFQRLSLSEMGSDQPQAASSSLRSRKVGGSLPSVLVLLIVGMAIIAMATDDYSRATTGLSKRYYHTDDELRAMDWIRDNTEPDALVCAPFGIQPVVFAIGERTSETIVVTKCIEGEGWWSAAWELRQLVTQGPIYIYLSTDCTKYGTSELNHYTEEHVFAIGGTFLRAPSLFDFKYHNNETIILKVSANITRWVMDQKMSRFTTYNLIGFIVSTVAGFLGGIIIARLVGGRGVGVFASAWALVELARPWGILSVVPSIRKSYETADQSKLFGTSLTFHLVAMVPAFAILAAFSAPLAEVFNSARSVIVISASALVAMIPASIGLAYLDSQKDFARRNMVYVVTSVSYLIFLGVLSVPLRTVESIAGANLLSIIVTSVVCLRFVPRPRLDPQLAPYFLRFGLRLVVIMFVGQVILWFGAALATARLGAAEGGIYRVASALAFYAFLLPDYVVSTWTLPTASSAIVAKGDAWHIFRQSTLTAVGLSALMLAVLVTVGRPVLGMYGTEFTAGYGVMVLLSAGFFINALGISATSLLYSLERTQRVMEAAIARGAVFLALSFILIPSHGLWAIAWAVVGSSAISSLALIIFVTEELKGAGGQDRQPAGRATALPRAKAASSRRSYSLRLISMNRWSPRPRSGAGSHRAARSRYPGSDRNARSANGGGRSPNPRTAPILKRSPKARSTSPAV